MFLLCRPPLGAAQRLQAPYWGCTTYTRGQHLCAPGTIIVSAVRITVAREVQRANTSKSRKAKGRKVLRVVTSLGVAAVSVLGTAALGFLFFPPTIRFEGRGKHALWGRFLPVRRSPLYLLNLTGGSDLGLADPAHSPS